MCVCVCVCVCGVCVLIYINKYILNSKTNITLATYLYIFCETSIKLIHSKDELGILFSFSLSHCSIKSHLSYCCLRVTTEILKSYTDIRLVTDIQTYAKIFFLNKSLQQRSSSILEEKVLKFKCQTFPAIFKKQIQIYQTRRP